MKSFGFLVFLLVLSFQVISCGPTQDHFHAGEIDLDHPTPEEENALMIQSRLDHQRSEKMRAEGFISESGQCRSGVSIPDPVTRKVIALTFDDGPNPDTTPKILDILKSRGVIATFFVLGSKARAYPEIMARIQAEGHMVASHSQTHKNFANLGSAQTNYEIKTPDSILSAYYPKGKFFRYPYGISSCQGNDTLMANKYQPAVGWHIDTCDWAMSDGYFTQGEAEVCGGRAGSVNFYNHSISRINSQGGGVALFHDIHQATARNIDAIVRGLQGSGYKFVRVDNKAYFPNLNKGLTASSNGSSTPPTSPSTVVPGSPDPTPTGSPSKRNYRTQEVDTVTW